MFVIVVGNLCRWMLKVMHYAFASPGQGVESLRYSPAQSIYVGIRMLQGRRAHGSHSLSLGSVTPVIVERV